MSFLVGPVKLVVQHRAMLWLTTASDLRARYAGSFLGLVWMFLFPLIFLGVYAVVYLHVFRVSVPQFSPLEYVLLIFCGLVPFLAMAEAISAGVGSVTSNAHLIKNTLFPIELVPVKAVLAGQCGQFAGTLLLLGGLAWAGRLTWWALLLPVVWLLQLLFMIGAAWLSSSVNVFVRDLQQLVGVLLLALMICSPIAFSAEMIPAGYGALFKLNPLYYFIVSYQDCLVMGRFPTQGCLWIAAGLAAACCCLGYWLFMRLKGVFADNV